MDTSKQPENVQATMRVLRILKKMKSKHAARSQQMQLNQRTEVKLFHQDTPRKNAATFNDHLKCDSFFFFSTTDTNYIPNGGCENFGARHFRNLMASDAFSLV